MHCTRFAGVALLLISTGCSNANDAFLVLEDPADADSDPTDTADVPSIETSSDTGAPDAREDASPDTFTPPTDATDATDTAPTHKRIFVTSEIYTGNLGGLAGADAKCQGLADAAKLGGTFKAWLSDSSTHAKDRLTHSTVPYTLVDGTKVAADWTDLLSGGIANGIALNEKKTAGVAGTVGTCSDSSAGVRTATSSTGLYKGTTDCGGWTNGTTEVYASTIGCTGRKDSGWTEGAGTEVCVHTAPIFCIEQ